MSPASGPQREVRHMLPSRHPLPRLQVTEGSYKPTVEISEDQATIMDSEGAGRRGLSSGGSEADEEAESLKVETGRLQNRAQRSGIGPSWPMHAGQPCRCALALHAGRPASRTPVFPHTPREAASGGHPQRSGSRAGPSAHVHCCVGSTGPHSCGGTPSPATAAPSPSRVASSTLSPQAPWPSARAQDSHTGPGANERLICVSFYRFTWDFPGGRHEDTQGGPWRRPLRKQPRPQPPGSAARPASSPTGSLPRGGPPAHRAFR
nr:protein FAM117B-like isoform X1 [Equus asinus]